MGCKCSSSKKNSSISVLPRNNAKKTKVTSTEPADNTEMVVAVFLKDVYSNAKIKLMI